MTLADQQVSLGGLLMGENTPYTLQDFNPWSRVARAEQSGKRAWNHGAWSGAEFADEAVVPMLITVEGSGVGGWLAAHQQLAAAFAPSFTDVELRFSFGGNEYVMFGRPRMVDPNIDHIGLGRAVTRAAFVALDPRIYSGDEYLVGPVGLPTFAGGLTVPVVPLNSNPFFETDASGWFTNSGEGSIARSTAQAHEGVASLLLTPDGVGAQAAARSVAATGISPGQVLRGTAWMRCAVARSVTLRIDWRNSSGTFLSSATVAISVAANTWTYFDLTGTAPASTAQAGITALMTGTPPSSNTLHIDEAVLSDPALNGLTVPFSIGAVPSGGSASLTNLGTTETGLRLRIDGPISTPRLILQRADGLIQELKLLLNLSAGQWVDIDTAAATAFANGSPAASRRGAATGVFPLLPKGTSTLLFRAADDGAGTVTARWRNAWW